MTEGGPVDNVIQMPALRDGHPTQAGIKASVDHLLQSIDHPDWRASIPAQTKTIQDVQSYWGTLDIPMRDALVGRLADALNSPTTRIELVLSLRNSYDIRKALRWQPHHFTPEPDEVGYPERDEGWLGNYLYYARECKASLGWQFWAGISVLGAACRRNIYFDTGGNDFLYPNHYLLLEGPSGTGKTTAINRATTVLEEANSILIERMGYDDAPKVYPVPERVTPSALYMELAQFSSKDTKGNAFDPKKSTESLETCAILPASELAVLLGDGSYNPREIIAMLTALYDGRLDDSTLSRGLGKRLRNIAFSCLFGSTLSWLRHNIDRSAFGGGFLGSRLLVISRGTINRVYPNAPPIDPIQRRNLALYLTQMMMQAPVELEFQPAAQTLYEEWFHAAPPLMEDDPSLPYFARRDIHLKKLMMVLTASMCRQPWITLDTIQLAISLLEREERFMLPAFRAIAGHADVEEMEWIESLFRRHGGSMKHSDLVRKSRARLGTAKRIDEVMGIMIGMEAVYRETVGVKHKGGRETKWYHWNKKIDLKDV